MFAVIKTGGKQYIVHPGDKVKIEKLTVSEGKEVVFDMVLLVSDKETLVGTPSVKGYVVTGKVLKQGRGKKIIVYKYKPKKRYHKKQGHRQAYTEVEIVSIGQKASGTATRRSSSSAGQAQKKPIKKPVAEKATKIQKK